MTRSSDFGDSAEGKLQSMPQLPLGQNSPAADIDPMNALKQVMPPPVNPSPSNMTIMALRRTPAPYSRFNPPSAIFNPLQQA